MNNMPRITRKVFVFILIALWAGYALLNAFTRAPYLWTKFAQGWSISSKLEDTVNAANGGIIFQGQLQDANGHLNNLLDKQTSNNFLFVKGENQQLIYSNFYPYETYSHYNEPALRIRELHTAAQKQGASLLYLNCTDLYDEGDNPYGKFPVVNFNARSDAFMYYLQGYGVEYLDARAILRQSDINVSEYRYKSEPHWTTEAAFEVYLKLLAKLKTQDGRIDPQGIFADRNNFERTSYQQSYIGKMGKRTGVPFAAYDDFTLITPNFSTDFTLSYLEKEKKASVEGDFSTVLLDKSLLDSENIYERDMYSTYLCEVYPFRKIHNNINQGGPKILIVGDSYMLPITTFLATAASEIHLFWPYSFPGSQDSLLDYIEANKFDHIIIGLSPMTLYGNGFNFLDGIELPELDTTSVQ